MILARHILDILFPPRKTELLVRDLSYEELLSHMNIRALAQDTVALLPYQTEAVRAVILEAKFGNSPHAQELLGRVLGEYLLSHDLRDAVLVPIPLSKKRYRERGYNQAQRIAEHARASIPDLEIASALLARTRNTLPQTTLGGMDRHQNVRGAFEASEIIDPERTYIVLDDVITTGATLSAAVAALSKAGARRILPLALAH